MNLVLLILGQLSVSDSSGFLYLFRVFLIQVIVYSNIIERIKQNVLVSFLFFLGNFWDFNLKKVVLVDYLVVLVGKGNDDQADEPYKLIRLKIL